MTSDGARLARPVAYGPRARSAVRRRFFFASSLVLFAVVLAGFARTFFLRPYFGSPPISGFVWVHGVVLTAWFVFFVVETGLIPAGRRDLHKKLGWAGAVVGVATVVSTLVSQQAFVARVVAPDPATPLPVPLLTAVAWGNYASVFAFALFLCWAVVARRRADVHKRAMYLATVSLIGPAVVRVGRWPVFGGAVDLRFSIGAVVVLVLALVAYDLAVVRRVHRFTALGGALRLALTFGVYAVGQTEFMQALLCRLA